MRINAFALPLLLGSSLLAQQEIVLDVTGSVAEHQLMWNTELGFNYEIYLSTDLQNWQPTGISEPGCGTVVAYRIAPDAVPEELFYRIESSPGPAFLIQPCNLQEVTLKEGVCFAFDLEYLAQLPEHLGELPEEIRISKREFDPGSPPPWEHIGTITDLAEVKGVKTVRGSVVWIPEMTGEFEVMAEAVDDESLVIDSSTRIVIVGQNQAPMIMIDGLFLPSGNVLPSPVQSATALTARFATTVLDPDLIGHPAFRANDVIRRVEFYDQGLLGDAVLIGTDFNAPFGDELLDIRGVTPRSF